MKISSKDLKRGNASCFYTPIVSIFIVAVYCIGHIDWLDIMVDDLNHLSPTMCWFLLCNPILLISQFVDMNRWLLLHSIFILIWPIWIDIIINAHFCIKHTNKTPLPIYTSISPCWKGEDLSSSETSLKMRTSSNCTFWSLTSTICLLSHIGKSKELEYIRIISAWGR